VSKGGGGGRLCWEGEMLPSNGAAWEPFVRNGGWQEHFWDVLCHTRLLKAVLQVVTAGRGH